MSDWQKRQGAECSCGGSDDMCPCQNVERQPKAPGTGLWKPSGLFQPRRREFDQPEIRIMPRVERIPGPNWTRPPCTETVRVSAVATQTRQFREEKTKRAGVPIHQCAASATHRIEGVNLCAWHAGARALNWLMGAEIPREESKP